MTHIFISHSKKDKDIIDFFLESFAGTNVKPHLEEFEKDVPSGITAEKIRNDIQASNAVFILLSENVEKLKHTRDWVVWECGVAMNKEIWVLEPSFSLGMIDVIVPHFNHYALYEMTEEWRKYIRAIIESHDDSHILPTLALTTAGGALINEEDRGRGAAIGLTLGLAGLLLYNTGKPSYGIDVRCWKCSSNYRVHQYGNFRCAVCNADSTLGRPQVVNA